MVTTLFALPGILPFNVVKEYRNQAVNDVIYTEPLPLPILVDLATGTDDPSVPRFLRHWTSEFDYLYLVGPHIVNPLPGRIEELTGGKFSPCTGSARFKSPDGVNDSEMALSRYSCNASFFLSHLHSTKFDSRSASAGALRRTRTKFSRYVNWHIAFDRARPDNPAAWGVSPWPSLRSNA